MPLSVDTDLAGLSPQAARAMIRSGEITQPTSGIASGFVQANLAFVPTEYADAFEELCHRNPAPLPLIERLPAGSTVPRWCASGADLASDTGKYMSYDGGDWNVVPRLERTDTEAATAFVIGCSFTAESALLAGGVALKQIGTTGGVPVYRSSLRLSPAGSLSGHVVVSMRAIKNDQVDEARTITSAYPVAHGGPIHVGPGAAIGCRDGHDPDWGVALAVEDDEIPMYWACGVTPQSVVEESQLPWAHVHAPGHMFITDIREEDVRTLSVSGLRAGFKRGDNSR